MIHGNKSHGFKKRQKSENNFENVLAIFEGDAVIVWLTK